MSRKDVITMSLLLSVLAMCLVLVAACSDDPTDPVPTTGHVEGAVTFYGTDEPVTDAVLVLVDALSLAPATPPTSADAEGLYGFADVPAGTYAVFVYHDSLVTFDRTASRVDLEAGTTARHDMRITPSGLWNGGGDRLEGTVTDAASGEPIVGAYVDGNWGMSNEVYGLLAGISLPHWDVTDSLGFYSVTTPLMTDETGQPVGFAFLTCIKEGYFPRTVPATDPSRIPAAAGWGDTVLTVHVALAPVTDADETALGSLAGQLVHLEDPVVGLDVALCLVSITDPGIDLMAPEKVIVPGRMTTTDAEGGLAFTDLVPGFYQLAPGYHFGDGYGTVNWSYNDQIFEVVADERTELGQVEIMREIYRVSPANGAAGVTTTPLLSWEEIPGADSYEVQWAVDGYLLDRIESGLTATQFQIPADSAVPSGSCVRWIVQARTDDPGNGFLVTIARTDWNLTFCVLEDGED